MLGLILDHTIPSRNTLYNLGRAEADDNREKLLSFINASRFGPTAMTIEVPLLNALKTVEAETVRGDNTCWTSHSFLRGYYQRTKEILYSENSNYQLLYSDKLWAKKAPYTVCGLSSMLEYMALRMTVLATDKEGKVLPLSHRGGKQPKI